MSLVSPAFVLLMLYLESSAGWTELSGAELVGGLEEGMLSGSVHSFSGGCCSATGGARGQPSWSRRTRSRASI